MSTLVTSCFLKSISGRVGNVVFIYRNGRQHMRPYVIPRNPDTPAQRLRRSIFAEAVSAWKKLPVEEKDRLNREARRLKRSGYNLFISRFMREAGEWPLEATVIRPAARIKPVCIGKSRRTEQASYPGGPCISSSDSMNHTNRASPEQGSLNAHLDSLRLRSVQAAR